MERKGSRKKGAPKFREPHLSASKLDALIEDAIVDAHDESEQAYGFFTAVQDNLAVPFEAEVLGADVTVESVDMTEREEIVAVCARGGKRQRIRILDLPLPSPPPRGFEWIEAYRKWAGGGESEEDE